MRNAIGAPVRHHQTFELALPDGRVLRTHISRPPDSKQTYGRHLWSHILKDQLDVTMDAFWACVRDGAIPERGVPPLPAETIPADVLTILINRGISEKAALGMSRAAALDLMHELLSKPTT